jgi:tetratricopeptide (TPR) repeat protein
MHMSARLRFHALVAQAIPVASVVLAGCAARGPAPADVATLEATLRADSSSVPARLQLAAAYARAGEAGRAVPLLEPVVRADSSDAAASLYLGIGYEAQERYTEARRLYERFTDEPAPAELKRRIEDRIELLSTLKLRSAVRTSIAQERALADVSPSSLTVGVFPFTVSGDTALRPLGRALAELLTTDLGQTSRLRVVERARVQMLLDELELGASRYADPATAARTGRIVGAGNLVQGALDGGEANLAMRAVVVATARPDSSAEPVSEQGGIARVIDMQKAIALEVYDRLGIQLTAAERQRVNRRPTENVQALLAFGFGLEARDAGRYGEAAQHFARAQQLDPGFQQAAQFGAETAREAEAASFTTQQLAQQAAGDFDLALTSFQREQLDLDILESLIPTPLVRDPSVEVLGAEGVGRGTFIDIVIRRPGGGP